MPLFDVGARGPAPQQVHDRWLTVPNAITAVRLAGLPVFSWLVLGRQAYLLAFWLLVVIASSDWVDGYVARRFDQVTKQGQAMDPLVDRLLLGSVTVTLLIAGHLPWPVVAAILTRDVILVGTGFVWFGAAPPIPVSRLGKFATACLLLGVPAFLLAAADFVLAPVALVWAWVFTATGILTYYLAAVGYGRAALRIRRRGRDL